MVLFSPRGKSRSTRPRDKIVEGDVARQTARVMENLKAIVEAAGSSLDKVVKTTVYLKDMSDFAAMNQVYGRYFAESAGAINGGSRAAAARCASGNRLDRAGVNHRSGARDSVNLDGHFHVRLRSIPRRDTYCCNIRIRKVLCRRSQ